LTFLNPKNDRLVRLDLKFHNTLDIYADAIPSRVDEAMARLGVLVSEGA
jgi:hypothetical protein